MPTRLSELDWTRVILVFAVYLHHVGMPFNGDDWVIMNAQSSKLLDHIMVYFEQFRLPTLFVIAGAGAYLLLSKISPFTFAWDKVKRLFLPLLVGMIFIIPPQLYFKNPAAYESLWVAYPALALEFDSMHLWFIEYLFVFSVLAIPLHLFFTSRLAEGGFRVFGRIVHHPLGLLSFGLLLAGMRVWLKEHFPSDSSGIENLSSSLYYLFFFIMGMVLVQRADFWQRLGERWLWHSAVLAVLSVVFYLYYFLDFSTYASHAVLWSIWWALGSLVAWTAALCILGVAQRFLTVTPDWLRRANELIYPFYILHQTVIVILAFYIVQWPFGIGIKISVLFLSSFLVTALICTRVIYPLNGMRVLFGLKTKQRMKASYAA
ncbi:hypothetical protein JCM17845_26080 [Iodidimonas gelatinilytica]|uniref:Acyltransferase 3 domain-containing protein n=1 Tax=Iodidimonas gelatinilytica TaxID=1236966 RepID=A0A5A7N2T4_9PROT|nr:acyltransferase [Iodidimonas gelatinilytica]GER01985.1 hypothetical protein JCM17845_26080 [Iodidimonas gelatinilytica]